MKIRTLILIVLFAITAKSSFSQNDSLRKIRFVLKTDILEPTIGLFSNYFKFSLTFETCFHNRHSVQLSGTYFSQLLTEEIPLLNHKSSIDASSFQVIPEYKFYIFKKKKYTGLFVGAFFSYLMEHEIHESTNVGWYPDHNYINLKKNYLIIGPVIGYQNYIIRHIAFEISIGAGYLKMLNYKVLEAINDTYSPIFEHYSTLYCMLRPSIKIGYKF
jgi:hypothetical protein